MRYFSKIIDKPNAIIEEQRDGFRLVKQTKICEFRNGVLDTEDPEVIMKLNKRPDLFSTKPWATPYNWKMTEEGINLLKEGEKLGIDCRHIRKEYLQKVLSEKKNPVVKEEVLPEPEKVEIKEIEKEEEIIVPKPTTPEVKINYKELMKIAKSKGINGFGMKKKALEKALKGVI